MSGGKSSLVLWQPANLKRRSNLSSCRMAAQFVCAGGPVAGGRKARMEVPDAEGRQNLTALQRLTSK
jgi:hypothetical protein